MSSKQPVFFIPHGGGPCFFMPDPRGVWTKMAEFLRSLPERLPETPRAILLVSAHWETDGFALTGSANPPLIYDYSGFPASTYAIQYPSPGAPHIAARVSEMLKAAGLHTSVDATRGLDHGVFIPLKVAFPDAKVPVIEMSLDASLDPQLHLSAGRALQALREQGVLIVASGMSFHNMRGYGDTRFTEASQAFDAWLNSAVTQPRPERAAELAKWPDAPGGRASHPRPEHLLPLMVAAGVTDGPGRRIYSDLVLETAISGFQFD